MLATRNPGCGVGVAAGRPPPPQPPPSQPRPAPSPPHVRSGVHQDGAHFVHAGFLQVGAGPAELMAAALEVLLLEDGNLEESRTSARASPLPCLHFGGAQADPGTSGTAQTSHSPKTALQRRLKSLQVQATAGIPLRIQVSLTGALPALSQCPGAPGRGVPTAGIKQLRGLWSTAATRGTRPPRHPGTARGQPRGRQLSADLRGQRLVGTDLLRLQRWWEISP